MKATVTTIQGAKYTTRRPSWPPTGPAYADPSAPPTRRPPTRAKMPVAAVVPTSDSQAACTTCLAAPAASMPRRVSGADEMSENAEAVAETSVAANT